MVSFNKLPSAIQKTKNEDKQEEEGEEDGARTRNEKEILWIQNVKKKITNTIHTQDRNERTARD